MSVRKKPRALSGMEVTLRERLYALVLRSELTAEQLSGQTGIPVHRVRHLLDGARPSITIDELARLGLALHLTLDALLDEI